MTGASPSSSARSSISPDQPELVEHGGPQPPGHPTHVFEGGANVALYGRQVLLDSVELTADLGYVVYLERTQVRLAGSDKTVPSTLRVTMIFRREEGTWKVAHRHADPIMTAQPISTILTVGPPPTGT